MGNSRFDIKLLTRLSSSGYALLACLLMSPGAKADYPTYPSQQPQFTPQQKWSLIPSANKPAPPSTAETTIETLKTAPGSTGASFPSQKPAPLPAALSPQRRAQASVPVSTMKLQAGITHSEVLSPLPESQRPGRVFRGDSVNAGGQPVKRFKVPDWLAGIWQRSEAKEISRVELPGGKKLKPAGNQVARVRDVFGSYRDDKGQVWQIFNPLKAAGQVDRGVSMDYHRVHSYGLVITGPKTVVVEVRATHTMVSKANRRIAKVYQDEELNKYTLLPDGRLQTDSSVKVFDLEGKPFMLTRTISSEIRLPPRNWPPRLNSMQQRN